MKDSMKKIILFSLFINLSFANLVNAQIKPAAECMDDYVHKIKNKKVGVVANHTSFVENTHLVDTLLSLNINITRIFSPEHGFKGNHSAGASVNNDYYSEKKIPIVSLYGNHKKPTAADLIGLDLVVFDMQDVGARFYTYISTMTYVMEACAENNVPMMVLDRPNPHGYYVDGPVLKEGFQSFVGMHKIPVVHGMTIGEYALMVNWEGWLKNKVKCDLEIIKCDKYTHKSRYQLPIPPSPNLQNMNAVYLYPSLCFFEGTEVSVGRGTRFAFETIGSPEYPGGDFSFTPQSIKGVSENPKHKGVLCKGYDLRMIGTLEIMNEGELNLSYLIDFYNKSKSKSAFFTSFFNKLAGNDDLRKQIESGFSEKEIKESWKKDLTEFKKIRKKYLLYPDFE
jgi:uncharacterized protein YbbC (DUF1343 family)